MDGWIMQVHAEVKSFVSCTCCSPVYSLRSAIRLSIS